MTSLGAIRIHVADDHDQVMHALRILLEGDQATPTDAAWLRSWFPPSTDDDKLRSTSQLLCEMLGGRPTITTSAGGTHDELVATAAAVQVLVYRRAALTAQSLGTLAHLRLVQQYGEGLDEISTVVEERGIAFRNLRRPSLVHVAEHCILLMLALGKRLFDSDRLVRVGADHEAWTAALSWPVQCLDGARLGLLGLGGIGTYVAQRAVPLGMDVRYHKRRRLSPDAERQLGITYRSLSDLVTTSDFLSIHLPYTDTTRHLVDRAMLRSMRPSAFVINTARGHVIDEQALVEALTDGTIAGAGLDVFGEEPLPRDHALAHLSNTVLTPHNAGVDKVYILDEFIDLVASVRSVL